MTPDTPAAAEITRLSLAIDDMWEASRAARLIAEHDPDLALVERISEIGKDAAIAEAESRPPSMELGDVRLRLVLETGLIVTFARPFTKGYGSGFPLAIEEFVPEEKQAFHAHVLTLRDQVYGHVDANAPEGFRRRHTWEMRPGVETEQWHRPRLLRRDELRAMADLADQIIERLKAARRKLQNHA
jgi:hypothetical protein